MLVRITSITRQPQSNQVSLATNFPRLHLSEDLNTSNEMDGLDSDV